MFRPQGEAPERAADLAAALEQGGHEVQAGPRGAVSAVTGLAHGSPDVVHAVGSAVARSAGLAARRSGAVLVFEPLPGDPEPSRAAARAMRTAATGDRGGAVLARDAEHAARVRAQLGLAYLPPAVGSLVASDTAQDSVSILLGVYDRLPHLNPELPGERSETPGRVGRWLGELGEAVRHGGLRRPGALLAYLRGRRLRARGRLPGAVEALTRATRRNEDDPIYGLYLAKALRESDRAEEALERLETIAGQPGDDPTVLGEVGLELTRLGRREQAQAIATRLADVAEDGSAAAECWAEAARIHAALGELDSARELALRAGAEARDGSGALRTAATALEQAGEPTEALELARRAGAKDQERRLSGLLRELGPGWVPDLDKTSPTTLPERSASSGDGQGVGRRILALLEVSLPHAPSGYAYRSRDLLAALSGAGFDPLAATRLGFPASRGIRAWSPVESVDGVAHHHFNVPGMRQYSGVPLDLRVQENAARLLDLVRRTNPAAVIAGTPDLNGVAALALRSATGIPVLYDVRGFPEMSWAAQTGGSETELYLRRRDAETACASEADAVITLSETMRQELADRGVDPECIFVVPHIVDSDRFTPRPRDPELARSYGLEGKLVVGSVTSLTDYEGVDDLIRAVALARTEWPQLAALIVGDGRYRPVLEALVAELGVGDSVVFTGRLEQDRVPDHYALLDLFAIPRRDLEVCRAVTPLKPFEALSMELPVLASDLPALGEIVSSSGGGRRVPPGSPRALAQVIVELGGDQAAREELGRSGREHVTSQHTPARASAALIAALSDVLGENGGRDER